MNNAAEMSSRTLCVVASQVSTESEHIVRNTMHAHAKTHMVPCTYGPASAVPLWRLSLSENLVTSACAFLGSIVALPVPLLLLNKLLSIWVMGRQT
jgi:hypothetical protein